VLDRERLREYWSQNREDILARGYDDKKKNVYTVNYIASYEKDLIKVYQELDRAFFAA